MLHTHSVFDNEQYMERQGPHGGVNGQNINIQIIIDFKTSIDIYNGDEGDFKESLGNWNFLVIHNLFTFTSLKVPS